MKRTILTVLPLTLALALGGCGDDDGGVGAGGDGGAITEESIRTFFEQQAPQVRAGAQDGIQRALNAIQGGGTDGVTITPRGGNVFDVSIEMDLGPDGNRGATRETELLLTATFSGDPSDGIQDADLPATAAVSGVTTPFGTYSANATIGSLGGGATVTTFLVQGTASLQAGGRTETSEYGYTADFTFPNIPLFGWESFETSGGGVSAEYEVCYRYNQVGGQYVRVQGTVGGSPFTIELGGQPSDPCDLGRSHPGSRVGD